MGFGGTKLERSSPWHSKSAIHSASFTSVLRPGTFLTCCALRKKIPELELALEGKMEEHHRFLLKLQLDRLQAAGKDLKMLEQRIQEKLQPYAVQLDLLQ